MAAGEGRTPWDPLDAAASGLVIDQAVAEVLSALRDAGIRSILLKGASFDEWLYEPESPRMYGDIDLLVGQSQLRSAEHVIFGLGYRQPLDELRPSHVEHAEHWFRPEDGMNVDLHRSLIGIGARPEGTWEILAGEAERMAIGGIDVEVLSEPARAMHVALHAAGHGRDTEKTLIDLGRALERLPESTWESAAGIAERLEATEAFAAGLRLLPEGDRLAARLGLGTARSVETEMFARSVPYSSWFVKRLAGTPGFRAKARLLARRTFPEPSFMRAWYPVARRGLVGLALAYAWRQLWILVKGPPAVLAWWRARRDARAASRTS